MILCFLTGLFLFFLLLLAICLFIEEEPKREQHHKCRPSPMIVEVDRRGKIVRIRG